MAAALAASLPAPQSAPAPSAPSYEAIPASMAKVIDIEAEITITSVQLDAMVSYFLPGRNLLPSTCLVSVRAFGFRRAGQTAPGPACPFPLRFRTHVRLLPMTDLCPDRALKDKTFGVTSWTAGGRSISSHKPGVCSCLCASEPPSEPVHGLDLFYSRACYVTTLGCLEDRQPREGNDGCSGTWSPAWFGPRRHARGLQLISPSPPYQR